MGNGLGSRDNEGDRPDSSACAKEDPDDIDSPGERLDGIDRRAYLKGVGVATAGGVIATSVAGGDRGRNGGRSRAETLSPPADEPIDREAMTETYVDPPQGADLADYVEDSGPGELLVVPPGDYTWTRTAEVDWGDWGIQGDPEADGEVTIWIPDGWGYHPEDINTGMLLQQRSPESYWGLGKGNVLIENLHLDSPGRMEVGFRLVPEEGGVLAHRIIDHSRGTTDQSLKGTNTFLTHPGEEGHVMIVGCCQHKRANISYDNNSQSFSWCSGPGEFTVRRCKASGMADNLVYTRMPGAMTVKNCVFGNTTPSSIRIGGDNEVVRDCTFWLDTDGRELHNRDGLVNTRLLAPDNSGNADDGGHVAGCSFVCQSTPAATGVIATISDNAWFQIEDCQFLLDQTDVPGIVMAGAEVTIEDTVFVTTTDSGATVGAAGTFDTTNVGVDEGLDPGELDPDYRDVAFDWNRAHEFPDPQKERSYVPVGEESTVENADHREESPPFDLSTQTPTSTPSLTPTPTSTNTRPSGSWDDETSTATPTPTATASPTPTSSPTSDEGSPTPGVDSPGFGSLGALVALGVGAWLRFRDVDDAE